MGFKPIACEKCGEMIPRRELHGHLAAACPMREATCNFRCIGCDVSLTQRDVQSHLEDCSQSHILLLLEKVMEQQTAIRSLTSKVNELESNHQELELARGAQADVVTCVSGL